MEKKLPALSVTNPIILSELYEIGLALTSDIDLANILNSVGESARRILKADIAVCHLYNQENNTYALATDLGNKLAPKLDRIPRPDGPTVIIAKSGKPLISNNAQGKDSPYRDSPFTKAEKIRSVIGLPLKKGDEIVGVLYINFRRRDAISQEIIPVAELIANQAAIAIYNARLFDRLTKRQETMSKLIEAGHNLSEAIAKGYQLGSKPIVKLVLDETAKMACTIINADCATIYPFDAIREDYYDLGNEGTWGLNTPLNLQDKPRNRPGAMATRVKEQELLVVNNITTEPTIVQENKFLKREEIEAFLGMSVHTEDTHLAVLYISFRSPHVFTDEEINTINIFGSQVGVALQVARLLEREQSARASLEMLALLNKIGSALSHRVIGIIGTTPVEVNLIRSYLNRQQINSPEIEQSLKRIESDTTTLKNMAASLKKLPELIGTPQILYINDIVTLLIEKIKYSYPGIELEVKLTNDLPFINVPTSQIQEVLWNVFINAVEHNRSDGKIEIETYLSENGREIEVRISDQGPGMDSVKKEKIFELFYSEKKGGLGFGLWWSRTFMRKIGGDIFVESEIGKGSTFIVVVPYTLKDSFKLVSDN